MCLGRSDFNMFICMFQTLSMCPCSLHGQDWGSPAYLDCKYVMVVAPHTRSNKMLSISCICRCIARDLQASMLTWTSNNPMEILFCSFIAPRGCAESKIIVAPVLILLKHASPRVVETAPKAQAKTTWWHDTGDHCIDVLVSAQSTGGRAHLVLSRFCLSLGMESDSVFHDLFPGMQPMPVLQTGLPIPSLNALPVHRANQVSK